MSEQQQWAAQVIFALSGLGTLESEIVRLTYSSRLTQTDTASRLDVPLSTVKWVIAEALYTLGSALEIA